MSDLPDPDYCTEADIYDSKKLLAIITTGLFVWLWFQSPTYHVTQTYSWTAAHFIGGMVISFLLLFPHEKAHEWTFRLRGYDAESRFIARPPHAIAANQRIDRRSFQLMLLSPLISIGVLIVIAWLVIADSTGIWLFDADALFTSTICFHVSSCINDIYQFKNIQLDYNYDTEVYMESTTECFYCFEINGFRVYYCDFED